MSLSGRGGARGGGGGGGVVRVGVVAVVVVAPCRRGLEVPDEEFKVLGVPHLEAVVAGVRGGGGDG